VVTLPGGKDPDDVIKDNVKTWRQLLTEILPIMDYTFNMVTTKLDLTTARDKSLAVESLLPIIHEIKDSVRQAHYLQKLARLVNISERKIEAELSRIRLSQDRRRAQALTRETVTQAPRSIVVNALEEYCLSLLLQHPELKGSSEDFPPEYFANSENREIFIVWQRINNLPSLKENLDIAIHEHLDSLANRNLPPNQIEQKYTDCILNLQKNYLRNLEAKRAEALALEAESGGTRAELARLEEEGIEFAVQLREIYNKKAKIRPEIRR
jgi:DNA primase